MSDAITLKAISDQHAWHAFVQSCVPNTFLHSWEWGQVQQQTGEGVQYLGIFDNNEQVGAALAVSVHARRGRHLFIPHGPLFRTASDARRYMRPALAELRELAKRGDNVVLRVAPLVLATDEWRQIFSTAGFRPAPLHVHAELTWELDITASEESILAGMRKTTRHAIRRAATSGITTGITTDRSGLARFMPLYEQTRARHNFTPFSRSFLEAQVAAFAPDKIYVAFATLKGRDVAAAILVHFDDTVYYHHGASMHLPSSLPAAHALQWAAIQEAKRRGATTYNFWGISPADQPNHPFAGITTFKRGFGGREIDYLHAQDLPLSLRYWPLWIIEHARRIQRGF